MSAGVTEVAQLVELSHGTRNIQGSTPGHFQHVLNFDKNLFSNESSFLLNKMFKTTCHIFPYRIKK